MTPEQLQQAKQYAEETYAEPSDNDIEVDWESTNYSENEDGSGAWVKAWLFVPREAYEAGSEVVPGG